MAITGHKTLAEVERYTRAAEQARLARQAMNRQLKTESGKPSFDKVANTTDELIEINSLINQMALPREGREVSEFNGLEKGLGGEHAIEVHSVSVATPKPLVL
jgi:hypothetical protein